MNTLLNYSNLEKFHDGSNNQIYRAVRVSDQTPVVIKIPRSEYPSNRELARLQNEYHLLTQLQAPGIAKVYSLEKFGRSLALVSESLEGLSLNALLSCRQLTISECLIVAIKLTHILEIVHAHQIVHRDIKPSNVPPIEKIGQSFPRPREKSGERLPAPCQPEPAHASRSPHVTRPCPRRGQMAPTPR